MNDTKWRKLVDGIFQLPFPPVYSRKDVLIDEYSGLKEDSRYFGDYGRCIQPFYSIEWIEIRPRRLIYQGRLIADTLESIEPEFVAMLKELNVPYKLKNARYFIYGYTDDFSDFIHNSKK